MKIKYLLFTIILVIPFISISTELKKSNFQFPKNNPNYGTFIFIEGVYHYSSYLKNSDKLANIMQNKAHGFEFKIGVQTSGNKEWQQYWGYPTYGIGYYSAFFGPADTIGEPSAFYIFYGGPMKRWNRLGVFYEIGLGVSYDFVKYDPITNPRQDIIGSTVNMYLSTRLYLQYRISSRFDGSLGLDLTHFSNGNTRTPNRGLNIYGPNFALKYNINPVKMFVRRVNKNYKPPLHPTYIKTEKPPVTKSEFVQLFVAVGKKTTYKQLYDGPTYFCGNIALDYTRKYSHIARWGGGLDFLYDSSLREKFENTNAVPFKDLVQLGIHLSNELLINRVNFITQFGYYLYSPQSAAYKGIWYLQIYLRVLITDKIGIQGGLKTLDGSAADFIEWGLYFRLMKK